VLLELGKRLSKASMKQPSPALGQWMASCRAELEALTAAPPTPPADFRREAPVTCSCADCAELKRFLTNPTERQHSFPMAEKRRRHLEDVINAGKCDLACTTTRSSSPHILVCTKTTASHERRVKEYHENLQYLQEIRDLQAGLQAGLQD
jgi:hypothetical protein